MCTASEHSIPINPALLRWAREDVGLSLEEAAARAKIEPLKQKKYDPATRLRLIEEGKLDITESILSGLSKAYRLPEVVFFLSAPPQKDNTLIDFRTVGSNPPQADTPEFAALKRRAVNLHSALRDIALENGDEPVSFINSVSASVSAGELAAKITDAFGVNPCESIRGTERQLFDALRNQAQERGVYVCLMGDLGHHTSRVDAYEFRGMVISDNIAPLIVINPNDTDKANVFTLVHEFAHLLLGITGISDTKNSHHSRDTEKLCNAAAAEYLLPAETCKKLLPSHADENDIKDLARHFKVSVTAAARRALELERISSAMYNSIAQRAAKAPKKTAGSKGPDPNIVAKSRIGSKIAQTMFDAAINGIISFNTAAHLLGISISRMEKVCS